MKSILHQQVKKLHKLADETPKSRNRYVDLLRAVAIVMVVVGHWLATSVVYSNGDLDGHSVLELFDWTHYFSWVFQIMPVFFLVGGYANAASLGSHYRRGGDYLGWVLGRTDRLVRPTTAFFCALIASSGIATIAGVEARMIGLAIWTASIPIWFLAVYLGIVSLAPLMYFLHNQFRFFIPLLLTLLVVSVDIARIGFEVPNVGAANHLLVWLCIHQFGYIWCDDRIALRPKLNGLFAAGAFLLLILLVSLGPYPVSMVNIPGQELQNQSPPSFALLVFACMQVNLVLMFSRPGQNWLTETQYPWIAVIGINSVILTLFIWHMLAAVIGAALLYPSGMMPQPRIGSAMWYLSRIPWIIALSIVLSGFTALFGRIESSGPASASGLAVSDDEKPPCFWPLMIFLGVAFVIAGITLVASADPAYTGIAGFPLPAVFAYFAGAMILRATRRRFYKQ
jgi:fucose 4-O-acetylase-like acetyltransferase